VRGEATYRAAVNIKKGACLVGAHWTHDNRHHSSDCTHPLLAQDHPVVSTRARAVRFFTVTRVWPLACDTSPASRDG
jgi:hypothetical protein